MPSHGFSLHSSVCCKTYLNILAVSPPQ
jgi:hypothetical protein